MDDKDLKNILFELDTSKIPRPNVSRNSIVAAIGVVLVLVLLFFTFYQIEPEEVGIILRFGAYIEPARPPGLHMKIPFVDQVLKVPVQRQLRHEFGFRTVDAGVAATRSSYTTLDLEGEALMLTGDLNVAVVEWIVQYRVSDPYLYLFRVRNVEDTFRDMNEAVMREIVGDRTVTEVLTVGRQAIEVAAKDGLQALCTQYETGITVDQIVLQDVNPPDPVKPSWDEVNQAQQQRDRLINEAQTRYNQVVPRAQGEAQQTVLQAEGYALDRVNRSEGDAARFKAVYEEYRLAPTVTRQRLYLETMQNVLPKLGGKLFIDQDAQGVMPLLPLESLRRVLPGGGSDGRDGETGRDGGGDR